MRQIFTLPSLVIILFAFYIGFGILRFEEKHGVLTYAEKEIHIAEKASGTAPYKAAEKSGAEININTASAEELQSLDGIGEKLSQRIISYREENGKFGVAEDIMKVSGIGQSVFKNIEDKICAN